MLSAANRLTSSEDFTRAVRDGQRVGARLLVVHCLMRPRPTAPPQVGLVVSKAVGNAVTRNVVKRRLRHLMRSRVENLPPGSLTVVRALPASSDASSERLAEALDHALAKVTAT